MADSSLLSEGHQLTVKWLLKREEFYGFGMPVCLGTLSQTHTVIYKHIWWQIKGKTNIKCLSKVLDLHLPPINVKLGWDIVTVKAIAHDSHHFRTYQTIQSSCVPYGWGYYHPERDHSHQHRNISSLDEGDHSEQLCSIVLLVDDPHLLRIWWLTWPYHFCPHLCGPVPVLFAPLNSQKCIHLYNEAFMHCSATRISSM